MLVVVEERELVACIGVLEDACLLASFDVAHEYASCP